MVDPSPLSYILNLEMLDLSNNDIPAFPEIQLVLESLKELKNLNTVGNPAAKETRFWERAVLVGKNLGTKAFLAMTNYSQRSCKWNLTAKL